MSQRLTLGAYLTPEARARAAAHRDDPRERTRTRLYAAAWRDLRLVLGHLVVATDADYAVETLQRWASETTRDDAIAAGHDLVARTRRVKPVVGFDSVRRGIDARVDREVAEALSERACVWCGAPVVAEPVVRRAAVIVSDAPFAEGEQ